MGRWLRHLLSAALLALCLLTIVSWTLSSTRGYVVALTLPNGFVFHVSGQRQDLEFHAAQVSSPYLSPRPRMWVSFSPLSPVSQSRGFEFYHVLSPSAGGPTLRIVAPHWFVLTLTASLSSWLLYRSWRRPRRKPGLCRHCGYDLRGNPASGRCPECGSPTWAPRTPAPAGPHAG